MTHAPLDRVRRRVPLAMLLALGACRVAPQLAPAAVGCYAVQLDSVPAAFRAVLVPPVPPLVQLDTAYGGQLLVPWAWLDVPGTQVRSARLGLHRPAWRIRDGVVVTDRAAPLTPLPPDSLVIGFGGPAASLTALLGAEPTGDWRGIAFVLSSATPQGRPMVPIRLQRTACGTTRMGVSRG